MQFMIMPKLLYLNDRFKTYKTVLNVFTIERSVIMKVLYNLEGFVNKRIILTVPRRWVRVAEDTTQYGVFIDNYTRVRYQFLPEVREYFNYMIYPVESVGKNTVVFQVDDEIQYSSVVAINIDFDLDELIKRGD